MGNFKPRVLSGRPLLKCPSISTPDTCQADNLPHIVVDPSLSTTCGVVVKTLRESVSRTKHPAARSAHPTRAQVVSRERRRATIRHDHPRLSLSRQCRLLSVSRSSLYHRPKGENAQNLGLMRRIDELFLEYPFYGSRQMVRHLWREGICVGRHRVRRLMRLMGLQAIYQAPRTTTRHPEHRIYPYLLKGFAIERPNQVWSADITYIPVQKGFLYLVAIMDWATRHVLSWRLSNTLDAGFCVEALAEALDRYGRPEIFNTDQGSQFTSFEFTAVLKNAGVAISMDGRGRCMDNIFIERLCPRWRHPGRGL